MLHDPGGVEQTRRHVLFDPFRVGIDFAHCSVGCTRGYSHSGPPGLTCISLREQVQTIQVARRLYAIPHEQPSVRIRRAAPIHTAHLRAADLAALARIGGYENQLPAIGAHQNVFPEHEKRGIGGVGRACEVAFLRPGNFAGRRFDADQIFRRAEAVEMSTHRNGTGKIHRGRFIGPDLFRFETVALR
jgi:hypothetical protein